MTIIKRKLRELTVEEVVESCQWSCLEYIGGTECNWKGDLCNFVSRIENHLDDKIDVVV